MAPVEKFTFWDHRLGGQRWHIYSSSLRSEKDSETPDGSVWKWPKSFYRWKRQQLSGTKADVRKILTPEPWWGAGVWWVLDDLKKFVCSEKSERRVLLQNWNSLRKKTVNGWKRPIALPEKNTNVRSFYDNANLIFCSPDGKTGASSVARLDRDAMANTELLLE